jgi:hypothetical protein
MERIECPECGCTQWESTESYSGIDTIGLDTATGSTSRAGVKYNAEGRDEWWCVEYQHNAPAEINDRLFALAQDLTFEAGDTDAPSEQCSEPGCDKRAWSNGWCGPHQPEKGAYR